MSTPRNLTLPEGVEAIGIETPVGTFAAHVARVSRPAAHVLLIPGWTGSKEDFTPLLPLLATAGFDATAYDQRGQFETVGQPGATTPSTASRPTPTLSPRSAATIRRT